MLSNYPLYSFYTLPLRAVSLPSLLQHCSKITEARTCYPVFLLHAHVLTDGYTVKWIYVYHSKQCQLVWVIPLKEAGQGLFYILVLEDKYKITNLDGQEALFKSNKIYFCNSSNSFSLGYLMDPDHNFCQTHHILRT